MGFLFGSKPKQKPAEQQGSLKDHPCCSVCGIHLQTTEQTMFKQPRPFTRIDVSTDKNVHEFKDVYEHDLLTFGIFEEDIPLLNALYLDSAQYHVEQKVYTSTDDKLAWLHETHAYSARNIDKALFRQWEALVAHVCFGRR